MATVLLVEDNLVSRRMFRDLLSRRFTVLEAGTAREAYDHIRSTRPDLIVTDVQLPCLDGLAFTRQLKADPATAAIPVVALSAYALSTDVQRGLEAGCADYIIKPIDVLAFVDRVSRALAASA